MNQKITEMTLVTSLDGTEDVPIVKSGANRRVKASVLSPASNVESGTYTPTLTNITNITSSTPFICQYLRVGSVVTVSGAVTIQATSAGSNCVMRMSIPIASNFGAIENCAGVHNQANAAENPGVIIANPTSDTADFQFASSGTVGLTRYFTFTYRII